MKNKIKSVFLQIKKPRGLALLLFVWLSTAAGTLWAQGKFDQPVSKPLLILFALTALALAPILLTMVTSFIKVAVVLALIRNALGTQVLWLEAGASLTNFLGTNAAVDWYASPFAGLGVKLFDTLRLRIGWESDFGDSDYAVHTGRAELGLEF